MPLPLGQDRAVHPISRQGVGCAGPRRSHALRVPGSRRGQAGLSWETILRKRENFRSAFDHFDPAIVAKYGKQKEQSLLSNPGIIRNRMKIEAAIRNARALLVIQDEFGTFDKYIWSFVGQRPQQNAWRSIAEVPARTSESDAMSKDLKRRGFGFVGGTICYAFMQAVGMVNDHLVGCFRHGQLLRNVGR